MSRLLFQLPTESRVLRLLNPTNNWGWNEALLNKATFLLEILVWQQTKDGQKKKPTNKPKMYTPKFMEKPTPPSPINRDSVRHTPDDIKQILSLPRG
jgi:hypothetical protein